MPKEEKEKALLGAFLAFLAQQVPFGFFFFFFFLFPFSLSQSLFAFLSLSHCQLVFFRALVAESLAGSLSLSLANFFSIGCVRFPVSSDRSGPLSLSLSLASDIAIRFLNL